MHNSPTTRSKVERRECGSARAVIMPRYYTYPFRSRGRCGKGGGREGWNNSRGRVRTVANAFGMLCIVSALSRLKTLHLRRIKTLIPGERDGGTFSAAFNRPSSSDANNALLPCDTLCSDPRLNSLRRLSHERVDSPFLTHSPQLAPLAHPFTGK